MIDFDATTAAAVEGAFAEPVTYRQAGVDYPAEGVFQQGAAIQVRGDDGRMHWTTRAPSIGIRSSTFPVIPTRNDLVTRADGSVYIVVDRQPDGVAMINLTLKDSA